jgi:hypothetical protein
MEHASSWASGARSNCRRRSGSDCGDNATSPHERIAGWQESFPLPYYYNRLSGRATILHSRVHPTRIIILWHVRPSRMAPPNPLSSWIASLRKRRASTRPALAYVVHYAVDGPARTTAGPVPAAMSGTRSTREECTQHAPTSGPRHSASPVPAGRRSPTGMHSD